MLQTESIFVTGGAGTLGRALARRRHQEGWTGHFTVYSRDEHKHAAMRKLYPDISYVQGDIRNLETLKLAMAGHSVVLHLGATKVIPVSEYWSMDTMDVNIYGSQNVCMAACATGVEHVLGISTDKACNAVNAYGATKYLMEKVFQEYARSPLPDTQFHLVRYGNVIESNGSVVQAWKRAVEAGEQVKITDPDMTRFWLSPSQAVNYVIRSLDFESGQVYIPKMPGLSIGKLFEYAIGQHLAVWERIPLRPGEKFHESLLTLEETHYVQDCGDYYLLNPTTSPRMEDVNGLRPYTSDMARVLTEDDLQELLADV